MNSIKFLFTIFCILMTVNMIGQSGFWRPMDEAVASRNTVGKRYIVPEEYKTFYFDFDAFNASQNISNRQANSNQEFSFPMPDGSFKTFILSSTPVFDEALVAKYPGFGSYTGKANDGSGDIAKMSVSPFGINVMIAGFGMEPIFIDPYTQHNTSQYQVYYKKDFKKKTGTFSCGVAADDIHPISIEDITSDRNGQAQRLLTGDCKLRSYRLALSCTGEYAKFHGGTVEKVLAAYNATMTRVNGIYERDAAITMKLIAETDKLIFLNGTTDPFNNSDGDILIDQNQTTVDNIIGKNNYDIGHVFSTGGGGIAQLRSPCTNSKAMGVTGQPNPIGDPFDIDYVAHEMGHQFGANHTQNNSCQRNNSTAVEPGSASTIMGYAGICDPNVQNNSDSHFHGVSLAEIANFVVAGNGNTCAVKTDISNRTPEVSVSKSAYTIPVSTAFALTAQGSDFDGDLLTYCWEQVNNETATMPPSASNTKGPSFRSLPPSLSNTRYFPDLARRYNSWEVLPSVGRTMNFRCTVRDNNPVGGCTTEADVSVTFTTQSSPFVVTYPNTGSVSWLVGTTETITWDVAKTDIAPINCNVVDIYLSIDGGLTYPVSLAENVPNNGTYTLEVPGHITNRAKVMVAAADNIFYDVSNANFKIISSFTLSTEMSSIDVCNEDSFAANIDLKKIKDISAPIELSLDNLDPLLTYDFSNNPVSDLPAQSNLTVYGLNSLTKGSYDIEILAQSGNEKLKTVIALSLGNTVPTKVITTSPVKNKSDVDPNQTFFSWDKIDGAKDYLFEISTSPTFMPLLTASTLTFNSTYLNLEGSKIYFWRVKANSPCVNNPYSDVSSFRTAGATNGEALILKNEPLVMNGSETKVIDSSLLDVFGINKQFIVFTITKLPDHADLFLLNAKLQLGDVFTMKDVLDQSLTIQHNGDNNADDQFKFDVLDDQNRWLPDNIFLIRVRQSGLGVTLVRDTGLLCFGDQNGVVVAEGYGGFAPYTYSIDGINFQSSPIFTGLGIGTYDILIKDDSGSLVKSNSITLSTPTKIDLTVNLVNYDLLAEAFGGTGELMFSIDGSNYQSSNQFVDPGNGNFTIYAKDLFACVVSQDIEINIAPLSVIPTVTKEVICASDKMTISCEGFGGLPPYSYSADGLTYFSNPEFQLLPSKYTFSIKDSGGKIFESDTLLTNNPIPIVIEFEQSKLQFIVNASGGAGEFTYSTDNITYVSNDTIVFPDNGSFKIYAKDKLGCTQVLSLNLNVLKDVFVNLRHNTCYQKNDGNIKLQALNGAVPVLYSFNGGAFSTTREWSNLPAGQYECILKDSKNDTLVRYITVNQPDSLVLDIKISGKDVTILTNGGTPPYLHSIDNGFLYLDTNTFTELTENIYQVAVKDKNGCIAKSEVILSSTIEFNNPDFKIYPNPTTSLIHIQRVSDDWDLDSQIELWTISGVLLDINFSGNHHKDTKTIDIGQLPSGAYMLHIKSKKGRYSKLLLKE